MCVAQLSRYVLGIIGSDLAHKSFRCHHSSLNAHRNQRNVLKMFARFSATTDNTNHHTPRVLNGVIWSFSHPATDNKCRGVSPIPLTLVCIIVVLNIAAPHLFERYASIFVQIGEYDEGGVFCDCTPCHISNMFMCHTAMETLACPCEIKSPVPMGDCNAAVLSKSTDLLRSVSRGIVGCYHTSTTRADANHMSIAAERAPYHRYATQVYAGKVDKKMYGPRTLNKKG